jgi:hypothetical protein
MNMPITQKHNIETLVTINAEYRETIETLRADKTRLLRQYDDQSGELNTAQHNLNYYKEQSDERLDSYHILRAKYDKIKDRNELLIRKEKIFWLGLGICLTSGVASLLFIIGS